MNKSDIKKGNKIKFGRYDWRVLDVYANQALLLSDRIVKYKQYHTYSITVTWESCHLRQHLNKEFYNTFNDNEKSIIVPTNLINPDNLWYGTSGGDDTVDNIFLLSIEDVIEFLGSDNWKRTPKAKVSLGKIIDDRYNELRIAFDVSGKEASWLLRSPGCEENYTADVNPYGWIDIDGSLSTNKQGVRPALKIKI